MVATITVLSAVVVGSWQRKAHGQQEALTVATNQNENTILVSGGAMG